MNKINKFYYINLDRRTDRKDHFLQYYEKENLPLEKLKRFTAIDGTTYKFNDEELKLFNNVDYKDAPFAKKIMGNQLSHYYILKEMFEKKYHYIVVFQDDVMLKHNFANKLNEVINSIPSDAELITIGLHKDAYYQHFIPWDLSREEDDYEEIGKYKINNEICILNNLVNPCSLAYIVTLQGSINLIDYFQKTTFLRATDWNYNHYLNMKNIFYSSNTILCTGNPDLGSDIFG
jgi:GR25 family glycosyltransferase involved in LPS biosynthesis